MYKPSFNSVLVEIDDADANWGGGNDESMLGKSYNKGTIVEYGKLLATAEHPLPDNELFISGVSATWNEGTEAGTTFEEDGKLYGFIYWWDVRGVKE